MRLHRAMTAGVVLLTLLAACSLFDNDVNRMIAAINESTRCMREFGPRHPSNYELVKATDAIVLARVRQVGRVPPEEEFGSALMDYRAEFDIQTVLKGEIDQRSLAYFGVEDQTRHLRKDDFSKPTRRGADPLTPPYPCGVPYTYRAGAQYLLFLVRYKDSQVWTFPKIPLGRLNEEVESEESPWFQTVKHYIRIAGLQDEQAESQALRELQTRARTVDDPVHYPPALVADVERHFTRTNHLIRTDEAIQ